MDDQNVSDRAGAFKNKKLELKRKHKQEATCRKERMHYEISIKIS
jgi:hypothetical protein